MRRYVAFFLAICARAQVESPRIGMMLDAAGAVRPVYGVPGSVLLGDATATGVLSTGCSADLGLSKTATSIVSGSQEAPAPPGPALFAIAGDAAFIYFPEVNRLMRWHDGQLDDAGFDPGGEVLALHMSEGALEFAVRRDSGVWIMRGNEVIDSLPVETEHVALLNVGVLYQIGRPLPDGRGSVSAIRYQPCMPSRDRQGAVCPLILRKSDHSEIQFNVDSVDALFPISDDYVQARAGSSNYAVRIDPGHEQIFLLPAATPAQLALYTFDGKTETPVGAVYDYGNVALGDSKNVRFRVRNSGNSAVVLNPYSVAGAGFTLTGAPTPPYTLAPGNFLDLTVRFSGNAAAAYSANLQVNTINVILLATAVPGALLTVFPVCTVDSGTINFGSVAAGALRLCNFSLQNPNSQALTISTLTVTGGFQGPQNLPAPFTLSPGQAVTFSIQATPTCAANILSGALVVNTRSYPLTLSGFLPALPKAIPTFDSSNIASGQQHLLTMDLAAAAPCGADGYVNLTFAPNANLADDQTIVFVALNTRAIPFHVNPGATQVALNGRPSAVFATGSTAGAITFSISGTTVATLTIPSSSIAINTATASNQRLGNLDINVTGFDNTYSAGVMSFTFLDTSGKSIGPVTADFTAAFKTYFAAQKSGSAFLMRVSFPVTGDQKQISGVKLTLTNAAGQTQTGTLTFQ